MLRGCQKKIVFLKNTGSKLFDEAYFVIIDKACQNKICDSDMITEANRIIDECIADSDRMARRSIFSRIGFSLKKGIIPFLFGVTVSIGTVILVAVL